MLAAVCLVILETRIPRSIGRIANKRLVRAPQEPWVIADGSAERGAEPRARALLPARRLRRSLLDRPRTRSRTREQNAC